jgi:hypothetical protein
VGVAVIAEEHAMGAPDKQLLLGGVKLVHRHFLWGDLILHLLLRLLVLRWVRGVVIAVVVVREPKPLPHHRGFRLLQLRALVVIVVGCHSLEKREFREGKSDRFDERERTALWHL